jgi:hypothetical protein
MNDKAWLESVEGRSIGDLIALAGDYRIDSIVVAIEGALLRKSDLSPAETVVIAIEAMEREVNNGGFAQFFINSSCEYAPVLVASLEQIGASKTSSLAQRAISILGATPEWLPGDYESAASDISESAAEALSQCDAEYYKLAEPIADKLFEFIRRNHFQINV